MSDLIKPIPEWLREDAKILEQRKLFAEAKNCVRAADEIERLRALTEWQPIETAPKDGTDILVYQTDVSEPSMTVCAFDEDWSNDGWWTCCDGKNADIPLRGPEPTHWQPLPSPPKDTNNE